VALVARDEPALRAVADEVSSLGGQALSLAGDVADPSSVEQVIAETRATFGRLDIAFNNAGDGHVPAPLADLALEDFERAMRVNVRGVFLCMKYEIAAMLETGGGAIVNMSSEAGISGVQGMAGYAAAKHGVIGLTRVAALDYAAQNLRVNAIAPGPIGTHRLTALPDAYREAIARSVPLGRMGAPDEVAAAVTWLCSDAASFVTGATLVIDGGRLAGAKN
jgi:NAD(P)-dependent dehydrogenase (short-subunit alcohol dehydrogenase family)